MALVKSTYGKARVRVMRIHRDGVRHEVRELSLQVMLTGDFARVYTHADNALAVATDTIKNLVNVVARENLALDTEPFCVAVAQRFLKEYSQVDTVTVDALETKWVRLAIDGVPHAHSFVLDNNGKNAAKVHATRQDISDRIGPVRLHLHEIDGVRLGPLRPRQVYDASGHPRSDVRDQHGCVMAMAICAEELSGRERKNHRDHAQGVRHHLQRKRPGQPLPHGNRRARRLCRS